MLVPYLFTFTIFLAFVEGQVEDSLNNPQIFINQSDSIFILAKYGQTVSLPCVIQRQENQELSNIHIIWKKLFHQRASVLSIGNTLLRQDMRYIVKKTDSPSDISESREKKLFRRQKLNNNDKAEIEYTRENWQFEIRRLNYEDAGVYQCSLPLAQPIAKNITLQVIPDLSIEPKTGGFKAGSTIEISCQATMRSQKQRAKKHRHHRATISWYKENEMLKNDGNSSEPSKYNIHSERVEMMFRSTLKVNDVTTDDSGKYRCIFENIQEHATIKVYKQSEYTLKNIQASMFSNNARNPYEKKSFAFACATIFAIYFKEFLH